MRSQRLNSSIYQVNYDDAFYTKKKWNVRWFEAILFSCAFFSLSNENVN